MRLLISGGGTGGHVYPALAVVQSLKQQLAEQGAQPDILWVGSSGGMEQALVERANLKIELISAAGLRGKNPLSFLRGLMALSQGYRQSRKIIRRFQPDVLFITGGYVCVPVTLAAHRAGVPVVIYLPDIEPGLAIKFLARFAHTIAVSTPDTQQFFKPGLTQVTGYPVRPELLKIQPKDRARQQLRLNGDQPVLLIFGGSQGARSINQAVTAHIEAYLEVCQVMHITGKLDIEWVQARRAELPPVLQQRYHVWPYLHTDQMVAALLAADVVISRAGASVLGEYPAIGLPAILVPLPIAGGHQALNANYLVQHGAAMQIDNAEIKENLKDTTLNLLADKQKLQDMSKASKNLAKPDAAQCIARIILEVESYGT